MLMNKGMLNNKLKNNMKFVKVVIIWYKLRYNFLVGRGWGGGGV